MTTSTVAGDAPRQCNVLAACVSADLLGVPVDVYVVAEREGAAPVRVVSARGFRRALGDGAKDGHFARSLARFAEETSGFSMGPTYEFKAPSSGRVVQGIEVTKIAEYAAAIVGQKLKGTLHHSRERFVDRCWELQQALSKLALVALVDEATGFQSRRGPTALNDLLRSYLLPVPGEWERAIPEELYVAVAALYGYEYRAGQSNRPAFLRSWTWRYVYQFLPAEVRAELQRTNANPHEGGPKHHQCLTPGVRDVLRVHVAVLIGVVRQSFDAEDFHMRFERQFSGGPLQGSLFGATPRAS